VESAAHLVDHVFPEAPMRQFVLTFPFPLRFLLAAQPEALTDVLAVVQRGISTFLIRRSGLTVASGARTATVTLIQRFGSALNLNPHLGDCSCLLHPCSRAHVVPGPGLFVSGEAGPYFTAPGARSGKTLFGCFTT
jgi:hypothetical protein